MSHSGLGTIQLPATTTPTVPEPYAPALRSTLIERLNVSMRFLGNSLTNSSRRHAAAILSAAAFAGASSIGFAAPALAHDAVLSSQPEQNETIKQLPHEIILNFSGEPQQGFNTISVSRDGNVLFRGEPRAKGQELILDVPDNVRSEPGEYTVGYQITSSDGHATRGGYQFTVDNPDSSAAAKGSDDSKADTTATSTEGEQGESNSSVPSWLLPVGGIVVIAGALVLAIKRYRDIKKD